MINVELNQETLTRLGRALEYLIQNKISIPMTLNEYVACMMGDEAHDLKMEYLSTIDILENFPKHKLKIKEFLVTSKGEIKWSS